MESDKEMDIINCVEIKQVTHGTTHVYYQISILRKTNVEAHEVASRINGESTKEALANRMGEVMEIVNDWESYSGGNAIMFHKQVTELKSRLSKLK